MACPLYCILSAGTVHCIPVATFTTVQETPEKLARSPAIGAFTADASPNPRTHEKVPHILASGSPQNASTVSHHEPVELPSLVKTRNLLYTLNNPSLSDLESEPSRQLSETSFNQDDEFTQDEEMKGMVGTEASASNIAPNTPKLSLLGFTNTDSEPEAPASIIDSQNTLGAVPQASGPESKGRNAIFKHLMDKNWALNGASQFQDSDTEQAHINDMPIGAAIESPENPELSAILNDYSTHAVYLPQYSVDLQDNLETNFSQIRGFLPKIFPAWQSAVSIRQLTGGITNMLLACSHKATNETLLMRVYGKGTNLIIDRNREFVSHLILNSLKLAPPIHARFANGLIYGFLPGRSLNPDELSHPHLYPLIAQQLGHWHNKINCEYIEDGIHRLRKHTASVKKQLQTSSLRVANGKTRKSINNLWDLLEDWLSIIPINDALVQNFSENLNTMSTGSKSSGSTSVTSENIRQVVFEELRWLRNALKNATRSEMVVCHCDLLSGNIIIPKTEEFEEKMKEEPILPKVEENPIQFIDYEYMIPAPRAFDIANHFAEWQGFNCNREAIPEASPENPVMVKWCKGYLNDENASEEKLNTLIKEIACYSGLPGFYWGIWAMIQSELSIIDFNYADYSLLRLEEYWLWKRRFTASDSYTF